ncbi:hypothetical protein EI555_015168, partial [Monodon monoceros]
YGFINTCLQSLVTEKFSEETLGKAEFRDSAVWLAVARPKSSSNSYNPAKHSVKRASAEVQDAFMTYTVYDDVITIKLIQEACKVLGVSMEAILKLFGKYVFKSCKMSGDDRMLRTLGGNLTDYLAFPYQEMNAPSFCVERGADWKMLLHYYSDRSDLCHIVPGTIEAVAKDFFDIDVTMDILDVNQEEERTGKTEHVVFLIVQKSHRQMRRAKPKGSQDTQDSQRDQEDEREIFECLCPVKKSSWEVVRSIVMFGKGHLRDTFEPIYPEWLWIEEKTFCDAFPFHVVFDESLWVKQAGVNIQKYVPGLQTQKIRLDEYFSIVHPQHLKIHQQFVLKAQRETMPAARRSQPALKLRGAPDAPFRHHPHDTTRDLVLLNQWRLEEIELSSQLERKKEELQVLSKHSAIEEKKTETLLYAVLPEHVANQLKEGIKVASGEFKTCTILFSDVVTFTNICAACEPIQMVNNAEFNVLQVRQVNQCPRCLQSKRVVLWGACPCVPRQVTWKQPDAYMVVGGVPVPIGSHAQRIANFALGMRISAKEIRVGIPTAPVLAGVMGDKMPWNCLFGDTSVGWKVTGFPTKCILAPGPAALENQGFEIIERGEIEVKGKMTTYFVIQNLNASEDEIMGRPQTRLDPEAPEDPCDQFALNTLLLHPGSSAQGRRDSGTLAVMRSADSRQLLPKSETARETSLFPNVRTPVEALLTDQPHQAVTCLPGLRLLRRGTHFPLTGLQRRASLSLGEPWLLKTPPGPGQSVELQGRGATHRAV